MLELIFIVYVIPVLALFAFLGEELIMLVNGTHQFKTENPKSTAFLVAIMFFVPVVNVVMLTHTLYRQYMKHKD